MPVAIILSASSHCKDQFLTSRISRFYTEERPNALSTLNLGQHSQRAHGHRIAKLGRDIEQAIFAKISKPELHTMEELIQKDLLFDMPYKWAQVEALAASLIERHTLSAEEAANVIQGTLPRMRPDLFESAQVPQ